jgi:hypothetical protein
MTEPKAHAKYAASSAYRWMNCPGSVALSETAPPKGSSSYADEGTKAHSCLEDVIKGMKSPALRRKGYSEEMISHAVDAWREIESRLVQSDGELLIEEKVFPFEGLEAVAFGTLDCAVVEVYGTLHIIDYKYGAGVAVEVEDNLQLIFYAIGVARKYNWDFHKVVLTVIQPRAEHEVGPIRSYEINPEHLKDWQTEFLRGIELSQKPSAPIKAGSWCRWCPASTICPEVSKKAIVQAQAVFKEKTGELQLPKVESLQIEHLGNILDAFEKLDFWMSEVRAHALHVLERGEKIKGWKLVQKRSTRKWVDEEKAAELAKKKFKDKAFKTELLSPAQFEKAVGDKKFLETHCSNVSSGVTVAHESDKRPAIDAIKDAFGKN